MVSRWILLCAWLWTQAAGACVIKVGYPNQNAPPYYTGEGAVVPERPGASVEYMRKLIEVAGCKAEFSRMPTARLRVAMAEGTIDMAPMNGLPEDMAVGVIPRERGGALDTRKSFEVQTMVFVRAKDQLAPDIDPLKYFKGRKLGIRKGSRHIEFLRESGVLIDDGAPNVERNLEKLLLGRIDGFAVTLISPADMDAVVRAKYGDALVRLEKPIRMSRTWFVANKTFFSTHGPQVEAIWNAIASNGRAHFAELLRIYGANQ